MNVSTRLYTSMGFFLAVGDYSFERKDLPLIQDALSKLDVKFMYEGLPYPSQALMEVGETTVTVRRPNPRALLGSDNIHLRIGKGRAGISKYVRSKDASDLPVGTKAFIDFIIDRPKYGFRIIEGTAVRRDYYLDKAAKTISGVCFIAGPLPYSERSLPAWTKVKHPSDTSKDEFSQRIHGENTNVTDVAIPMLAAMDIETGTISKLVMS